MPLPTRSSTLREPRAGTTRPGLSSTNTSSSSTSKIGSLRAARTAVPTSESRASNGSDDTPSLPPGTSGIARPAQSPKSSLPHRPVHTRGASTSKIVYGSLSNSSGDVGARPTATEARQRGKTITESSSSTTNIMSKRSSLVLDSKSSAAAPIPEPTKKTTSMGPPPRPMRSASLRQATKPTQPSAEPPVRGHVRNRSTGQALLSSTRSIPKATETSSTSGAKPVLKPSFNTFQQHYSPKRPARAPAAPSAEAVEAENLLRSETSHLQNELLQLLLLREDALVVQEEWKQSARIKLEKRFEQVLAQYQATIDANRDAQRQVNHRALDGWLDSMGEDFFLQTIETISRAVQLISDITAPGGRYTRLIEEFETWAAQVSSREEDTKRGVYDEDNAASISLPAAWNEQLLVVEGELGLCRREWKKLPIVDQASGLGKMLSGHRILLDDMILELKTLREIQSRVESREKRRLERVLELVMKDEANSGIEKQLQRPIWQTS